MNWLVIENIAIYIIVAVLFYITRSPWVFLLLLCVNITRVRRTE